jgi:hypothetical protein
MGYFFPVSGLRQPQRLNVVPFIWHLPPSKKTTVMIIPWEDRF